MGAEQFQSEPRQGATAYMAFQDEVREALYWHGHSGYTGTIGEKDDYYRYDLPKGITVDDFIEAANKTVATYGATANGNYAERPGVRPEWADAKFDRAAEYYNDKHGPAICIEVEPDTYVFCGWASA